MPFVEAVRLALEQLRVQKLKSFFTLLGVMVGVMFLIAVVSIIEGAGQYMEHDLVGKLMAVNSFEVRYRPKLNLGDVDEETWAEYRRRPRIYESDTAAIVNSLPAGFRHAVTGGGNIAVSSEYVQPKPAQVLNVTHEYFAIKNLGVTNGRVFNKQKHDINASFVVIGEDVRNHFFPGLDPVGRELRIGDLPYQVIGVAEKQGSTFGLSLDKFVIVPYGSPAKRFTSPMHGVIDAVIAQAPSEGAMIDGEDAVRQAMRSQHKLLPEQKDDFTIETSESALAFWNKIKSYLVLAGIALPAIGLVVGAIVIMNIMLVAVAERTHEIGIRKSLGAKYSDILSQFLIESATLSTIGSALGVAIGALLALIISSVTPLPAHVALWSVVVSVLLGAGVGIAAGVYPASRAARLDPITALRAE